MKILIVDYLYPDFVRQTYADTALAQAPFHVQLAALDQGLFGETQFQAEALRALGHEALHLPINVQPLMEAYAGGVGASLPRRSSYTLGRRGLLPVISRRERGAWLAAALAAVTSDFQPDLIHVQCMDVLSSEIVATLRAPGRVVTGQTAAPQPPWSGLKPYDLLFSSLPNYVERYRRLGVPVAYLPLAFAPRIREMIGIRPRDVSVSFIGSITSSHSRRVRLIRALSDALPVTVWTSSSDSLGVQAKVMGSAFGRDMYVGLARSAITVNVHGEHAEGYANNLRLFEATGMGALLVTEASPNLEDLFVPGREVITYDSETELIRAIQGLLERPDLLMGIAEAGHARTVSEHDWHRRMGEMLEVIEQHTSSA